MQLNELVNLYAQTEQLKSLGDFANQIQVSPFGGDLEGAGAGSELHLKGLIGSQEAFIAAALFKICDRNQFFILPTKEEAAYFQNNLKNLLGNKDIFFFPDSFRRPQDFNELSNNNVLLRTETVNRISNPNTKAELIVTYPEALLETVVKAEELEQQTLRMKVNEKLDIDFMIELLVEFEFERVDFVYEPGQFSIRGDIVDVFSYGNEFPYRVELFDNEIESIRTFDPLTQLSIKKIASVTIVPNMQTHFGKEKKTSVFNTLPAGTLVWLKDADILMDVMNSSMEKAKKIQPEIKKRRIEHPNHPLLDGEVEEVFLNTADFLKGIAKFNVVEFGKNSFFKTKNTIQFYSRPQPSFNKNFDLLIRNLNDNTANNYTNLIFAENQKQIERFYAIFADLKAKVKWTPVPIGVHQGFIDEDLKVVCYTDHQIFNRYHKYNLRQGFSRDKALMVKTLKELKPGDFVTHIDHGVGVYSGLEKIEVGGQLQEAVRLIYASNDILYVGIQSLHKISKYVGKEGEAPRINKLGSETWANLKKKTKKKIKEIAFDLIQLYARRKAARGFQFSERYLPANRTGGFIYV